MESIVSTRKYFPVVPVSSLVTRSYEGAKPCTLVVGENADMKPLPVEANKTSSSAAPSSSQPSSRTRQQTSSGGSINPSASMLEHVYIRRRRDTFNQHALHQNVAPPNYPEAVASTEAPEEASRSPRQTIPSDADRPGKVVHENEHVDGHLVKEPTSHADVAFGDVLEPSGSAAPSETVLAVNVSDPSITNYSHDRSTDTTVAVDLASQSSVSVVSDQSSSERPLATSSSPSVSLNEPPSRPSETWSASGGDQGGPVAATTDPVTVEGRGEDITEVSIDQFAESTDYARNGNARVVGSSGVSRGHDGTRRTSPPGVESMKFGEPAGTADGGSITVKSSPNDEYSSVNSSVELVDEHVDPLEDTRGVDATTSPDSTELESTANSAGSSNVSTIEWSTRKIDEDPVPPPVESDSASESAGETKAGNDETSSEVLESESIPASGPGNQRHANDSNFSGVVKETRELSREESSSESDTSPSHVNSSEKSEELQRDYPLPIYNYGQEEVEIVKLNHKSESGTTAEARQRAFESLGDEVKTNNVPRLLRQNSDLRVITRVENDEEFLREFERKFREKSAEAFDEPASASNRDGAPKKLQEPSNDAKPAIEARSATETTPPLIQQVKIVEVPVQRREPSPASSSSTPSSSNRVLVNITIASGDSASSKPLYVLSVSVPTNGDADAHSPSARVHEHEAAEEPAASVSKTASSALSEANNNGLPPPPQPPSSPPPPIWAGGECECSCPCMGSSSDEWDNLSVFDDSHSLYQDPENSSISADESTDRHVADGAREQEDDERKESSADDLVRDDTTPTAENDYSSTTEGSSGSTDWTPSNYEAESRTESMPGCSGTTPLPPEPTILILEGEAPFTILFEPLLSYSLFFFRSTYLAVALSRCFPSFCHFCSRSGFLFACIDAWRTAWRSCRGSRNFVAWNVYFSLVFNVVLVVTVEVCVLL